MPEVHPSCPRCHDGRLVRVRRTFLDRVISIARPVHRMKCMKCRWCGRMRATGTDRYSTVL